jgi:hypothetical protein
MLPFPFFSKGGLPKWLTQNYFNNDIHKFVQEMVEQSISSSIQNAKMMGTMYRDEDPEKPETPEQASESLHATIFESNSHVYVRMFIKDESVLRNLKIYHNSSELVMEGFPSSDDRHVIALPSPVKMKESIAEYEDNHLQIKMRKKADPQFTEVAVPKLD